MPAAVNRLSRARLLLAENDPDRLDLLPQLAYASLEVGDFAGSEAVLAEATESARDSGDSRLQAHALVLGLSLRLWSDPEGWTTAAEGTAPEAIATFEKVEDERGLAHAWSLLGLVHLSRAHFGPAEVAWREAAAHAHRAGDRRDELESLAWVPLTVWAGPTHVDDGLWRCREVLESVEGDKKATSSCLMAQAVFEGGLGHVGEARRLIAQARALLEEVALTVWLAGPLAQFAGWVELLADDAPAAERELRWGYNKLVEIGELGWLSTVACILGESLCAQGRHDEAEQLTTFSEESADAEDAYSQALWRSVRAKTLVQRGEIGAAVRLPVSPSTWRRPRTSSTCAGTSTRARETCPARGQPAGGPSDVEHGLALAEQKGSTVVARRTSMLLERVRD